MENLQQFWLSIGAVVVIGVVALLWFGSRVGKKPTPTPTPQPKPIEPTKPAPTYLGAFLWKPIYQKGERLIFQTTPQTTGCGETAGHYGIQDNGTGPYGVIVRAYEKATGKTMPVYVHDGGPQCDGQCVDSGAFDIYIMTERPYHNVGSLVGCNQFVPHNATLPVYVPGYAVPRSCNPPQSQPQPQPVPGTIVEMMIEVTVMNQWGSVSGPYQQIVMVDTQGCV